MAIQSCWPPLYRIGKTFERKGNLTRKLPLSSKEREKPDLLLERTCLLPSCCHQKLRSQLVPDLHQVLHLQIKNVGAGVNDIADDDNADDDDTDLSAL